MAAKDRVSERTESAQHAQQAAPANPVISDPGYLRLLTINEIATVVRRNWPKVYFGAVPYLEAMQSLEKITDSYGLDSGTEVVNYFLANANTWRGEVARAVKKELNDRVKSVT